jgi:hypothetical protein
MAKTSDQSLDKLMEHALDLIQSETDPAVKAELEKRTKKIIKDSGKKKP